MDASLDDVMTRLETTALKIADDRNVLKDALLMALDYFEDRADVYDGPDGEQRSNECAHIAHEIRTTLHSVGVKV